MFTWIKKADKWVIEGMEDIAVQFENDVHKLWQGAGELLGHHNTEEDAKAAGEKVAEQRVNPAPVVEPVPEPIVEAPINPTVPGNPEQPFLSSSPTIEPVVPAIPPKSE